VLGFVKKKCRSARDVSPYGKTNRRHQICREREAAWCCREAGQGCKSPGDSQRAVGEMKAGLFENGKTILAQNLVCQGPWAV